MRDFKLHVVENIETIKIKIPLYFINLDSMRIQHKV